MIPKIAHFHWTGPPMSWLRVVTIASFKKFNPTWEIRIHDTPPDIRAHGLRYCNEADWTWWRVLAEHGGFLVGTDIVFTKPVPEEWRDCSLNACKNGTDHIFQYAMMGAERQHPLFAAAEWECKWRVAGLMDTMDARVGDQAMGVPLLEKTWKEWHLVYVFNNCRGRVYDQPMDALCYTDSFNVDRLWDEADVPLPDVAIGVHWYGAHPRSLIEEPLAKPDHPSYIVRLAEEVFP